jgi:nucleoside-diphosphate-sugar epimerase
MIVEGHGLLGAAFARAGRREIPALVFARGVADSTCEDPVEYTRELDAVDASIGRAAELGLPFIYFSSAPVYGHFGPSPVSESGPARPTTAYGRHKAACEERVRASIGQTLIIRLPNVIGPGGHPHQLVPALVGQVLEGRVVVLDGAGRDLLDVDDVVRLTERLLDVGGPARLRDRGRTVNVASGICTPVDRIVRRIAALLGRAPVIERRRGGEPQHFDTLRLIELIGPLPFDPTYPGRILDERVPAIAAALGGTTVEARGPRSVPARS